MKRLGRVDLISHNGCLLLRGDFAPQEGAGVTDKAGKSIGRISRVFGPVAAPFVSIEPAKDARRSMVGAIGQDVFIDETPQFVPYRGARRQKRGVRRW
jgi:rRNA processing protein Gar1